LFTSAGLPAYCSSILSVNGSLELSSAGAIGGYRTCDVELDVGKEVNRKRDKGG
jgi:hypothetical protein